MAKAVWIFLTNCFSSSIPCLMDFFVTTHIRRIGEGHHQSSQFEFCLLPRVPRHKVQARGVVPEPGPDRGNHPSQVQMGGVPQPGLEHRGTPRNRSDTRVPQLGPDEGEVPQPGMGYPPVDFKWGRLSC